ncbi:DUF885 family protein [Nocardiopsis suaedae]|uniref:DUF885 family protein n=1 Tax=Nocardiopsis suaedae TaxID=3018444 RepID=A0ABT4TP43_9ACTN|nr:DUF885 family protein [Nocardiopsis suaedae]MDA2806459.1 DUF885 family protein [Nocardiopsis suaedae]
MDALPARLRAIADLQAPEMREGAGRHEYDGTTGDMSKEGVRAGLARLGGEELADPHDEAHTRVAEEALRCWFGDLQAHRTNPLVHLDELDLSCYSREYAPEEERREARLNHLRAWPQAAATAVDSLDRVSAPTARALLAAARGLAAGIPDDTPEDVRRPALVAHAALVSHLEKAARDGDPSATLGGDALARLMGVRDGLEVDLGRLAERADAERDRLMERLAEATGRLAPGRPALEVSRELVRDHPGPEGVMEEARMWTRLAVDFTRERGLAPYSDGAVRVSESPESRRWATAMLAWAGPGEADGDTNYFITPPDPDWPEQDRQEWLEMFSATTLPAICVHEVAPGHYSHGRALRRTPGQVRPLFYSVAFIEGWAHYAEELSVEEGFGAYAEERTADRPGARFTAAHFEAGVWLEALIRVTRLAAAIGVHTGAMTVEDAARRFAADTALAGPAALAEAQRAVFDPTYGRYTWGKLEIQALRERARREWGAGFTLPRFHAALLELGAPPLGLMGTALERG